MRFKTLLPWIVLQSVLLDDHAHTHASQFLLSLGRVNDPTPVLSDTCFSPLSQSEKRGNLCWHEINLGRVRGNHNTTLICVCHCSPLPDSLTHRERHIQTEEVEIKGTYSVWPGLETWPKRLSKFSENVFSYCALESMEFFFFSKVFFFIHKIKAFWFGFTK